MKKYIAFIIFLTYSGITNACDFCNSYLGLDPGFNKNTIALRANFRKAEWQAPSPTLRLTHGGTHTDMGTQETLEESFFTSELFVKYTPFPKLRIYATLPYTMNTLEFGGVSESRSALSDLSLMAMYQLLNSKNTDSTGVGHRLFAGAGVKFPTGKSEGAQEVDIPMAHHLYSGTGSTDYLACLTYIGKVKKLGWSLDASYKFNGESCTDYRYGNTINVNPVLFYETRIKSVKILPHAGAPYEAGVEDEYKGETVHETGGTTWYGSAGVDVYFGAFSVTTDFRLPFYHDMGTQMSEDQSWVFGSFNFHF